MADFIITGGACAGGILLALVLIMVLCALVDSSDADDAKARGER